MQANTYVCGTLDYLSKIIYILAVSDQEKSNSSMSQNTPQTICTPLNHSSIQSNPTSVSRSYMEGFTIHGLTKVFMGKLWEQIYWLLILMAVLGFVAFKIHGFHGKYQGNEYRTEIRMVDTEDYPELKLKICNKYLFDNEELCFKNKSVKKTPCHGKNIRISTGSTPDVQINVTSDYYYPASCVIVNTSKMISEYNGDFKKVSVKRKVIENVSEIHKHSGFYVHIGSSSYEVKLGLHSINIRDVKIINRLRSPFKSNCTNGAGDLNVFPGAYTIQKCIDTVMFKTILSHCGAAPDYWRKYVKPHHERGWDKRLGKQTEVEMRRCMHYFNDLTDRNNLYIRHCPLPCRELLIDSSIETKRLLTIDEVEKYGHSSGFAVKFQSKRVTEVTEVPVYTSDDFFSDVGSWLGLLVGMSFLSLVELFTFLVATVVERFCKFLPRRTDN